MKRLILAVCLLASLALGADWSAYYINGGNSPYVWIVAPTEMLTNEIPAGIKWSTVPTGEIDEEGEPILRQKTLEEYIYPHMRHDLGDGNVLFLVRAMQTVSTRPDPMTDADADLWAYYFAQYGYTNFLTKAEADVLLPEPEL